jgi:hypothetical protein
VTAFFAELRVIGVESEHCTNEFSNYRILTPPLHAFPVLHGDFSARFQLPVFDASVWLHLRRLNPAFRIHFSRRQKPVVDFTAAGTKIEASE